MAQLPDELLELPKLDVHQTSTTLFNERHGCAVAKLTDELIEEVQQLDAKYRPVKETDKAISDRLAGHLKKEHQVQFSDKMANYAISVANELAERSGFLSRFYDMVPQGYGHNYEMEIGWINYQEKYDFQPPHTHSGAFSFVIWHKIPYDLEEELNYYGSSSTAVTSLFCFQTITANNVRSIPLKICKEVENYICVFPSDLHHLVHPFYTSDDYRVSLSGNIRVVPCPPKN